MLLVIHMCSTSQWHQAIRELHKTLPLRVADTYQHEIQTVACSKANVDTSDVHADILTGLKTDIEILLVRTLWSRQALLCKQIQ